MRRGLVRHHGQMLFRDLLDDGQAQAGTAGDRVDAVESRERIFHDRRRQAIAIVGDFQREAFRRRSHADRDNAGIARVPDSVVDQVGQHFAQQHFASQHHGGRGLALVAQINVFKGGGWQEALDDLAHELNQIDRLLPHAEAAGLGLGERQQLLDQVRRASSTSLDLEQAGTQRQCLGFVERQLGLKPESCERRTQLVGRIGDEMALRLHRPRQPRHHQVDRFDQGTDFNRGQR